MAESLTFGIAENLLGKLGSLAYEEACLAWGVKANLEKLEDTLSTIKSVLLDAEEQQVRSHGLRDWLQKLKDACYDAEDVLDEFEIEALRKQIPYHQSIERKVRNFFSSSNPVAFRFRMGHKIKTIRERFDEIAAIKAKFNLTERVDNRRVMHRERELTHSFVLPSDVIGRDKDKENIIKMLIDSSDSENVSVIPIVGIGGLGKTALTKLVYNDQRVLNHFDLKMWVCVSENFVVSELILKVTNSATGQNHNNLDIDQLQNLLQNTLSGKKYLLVLDDVWSEDPKKWIEFKHLLLKGAKGSKIIVTTRSTRVASIMGTMEVASGYKLEGLPYESCFSLFKKCAFKEGQEKHPNLVKIGEEIVKKCGGIPLAIKTLGSLLCSTSIEHDWKYVRDNEIWKLEQNENDVLPALKISYDLLPPYLKQCFFYCSIFPKDYDFHNDNLIHFWMALGLLQSHNKNDEIEDIGMRYLRELSSRCFFQDFEEKIYLFRFKMHDLIHDLAQLIAKDECLIVDSNSQVISKQFRHLSFVGQGVNTSRKQFSNLGHVRTIFFPNTGEGPNKFFVESCISRFPLLRVLDLSDSNIEVLPKKIGNLKHLRYLKLARCVNIKKLPNSICKLQSLQALNLGGCKEFKELPKDIRYLISLRLLFITTTQKCLQEIGNECLNSLQYLVIYRCKKLEYLIEDISCLKVLRSLEIDGCPNLISLPRGIKHLSSLEILMVYDCKKLDLNLEVDLTTTWLKLRMLILQGLPQLMELPQWLLQASADNLHHLAVKNCPNFMIQQESLRNLKSLKVLYILNCPKSSYLSNDMQSLTNLRQLVIE